MKIVCDISEKDYNNIEPFLKCETINGGFNLFKVLEIIRNGTPLPKHHGRLIDADELRRTMEKDARKAMSFVDLTDFVWLAPTIIEAESED